ncbi:MAG: collagen-like protein [Cystobacter sp.]
MNSHAPLLALLSRLACSGWLLTTSLHATATLAADSLNPLVITQVELDRSTGLLNIHGRNFGTGTPSVTFADEPLLVRSSNDTRVLAELPANYHETRASYLLIVSVGPNTSQYDAFDVTLGATGPRGEKGDKGDTGAMGPQGPKGGLSACTLVRGESSGSSGWGGKQSVAQCEVGDIPVSGACRESNLAVGTSSQLVINSAGAWSYQCTIARNSTNETVRAQVLCCKP